MIDTGTSVLASGHTEDVTIYVYVPELIDVLKLKEGPGGCGSPFASIQNPVRSCPKSCDDRSYIDKSSEQTAKGDNRTPEFGGVRTLILTD